MATKFITLERMQQYNELLQQKIADGVVVVDTELSETSENPVQNKVINAELDAIADGMSALETAIDGKADAIHSHDDLYYTENEIDAKFAELTDGSKTVSKAETAESATKATQDASGNVITNTYETKADATAKLSEAKGYADSAASAVKNELLNGAGEAYDTLKELGELIEEKQDAIEALEVIATGKADKEHTHSWNDLEDKPFYEEVSEEIVLPETTEYIDDDGYRALYNNVKDLVVGETYKVVLDGTVYECVARYYKNIDYYVFIGNGNRYDGLGNNEPFCFSIKNDDRLYIYVNEGSHTFSITHITKSMVQLDEKYIPDTISRTSHIHSWNDLEDKPFGESLGTGYVIDNKTIEMDWDDDNGGYEWTMERVSLTEFTPFIAGETYTITLDGINYGEVEAVQYSDEQVRLPFIYDYKDAYIYSTYNAEYQTCYYGYYWENSGNVLSVSGPMMVVNPLDAKYIPDTIARTSDLEGLSDVGQHDKTYHSGEIFNDYKNNVAEYYAHAEGSYTEATGSFSHAEGHWSTAEGESSHAEGDGSHAKGWASHAEGNSHAEGSHSHSEGRATVANGDNSHSEGYMTTSNGENSHAEGDSTIASGSNQHVQGKWNIEDTENKYAHIVGNGTENIIVGQSKDKNRSNAHTLDWSGNAWFAGNVFVGGTSQDDGSKLMTESDVDTKMSNIDLSTKADVEHTHSWDELEDKPFGAGGEDIHITWDGDISKIDTHVHNTYGDYYYCHISDLVPTNDQISQGFYSRWNMTEGLSELIPIFEEGYNVVDYYENWVNGSELGFIVIREDNLVGNIGGHDMLFPKKGIYLLWTPKISLEYGEAYWYTTELVLPAGIKQLDEKYIPSTIARITDIPEFELVTEEEIAAMFA